MSVDSSKEGREWMVTGAKSINVRLDDDECYIRIPSADDYEFIGPMPVDLAVEIVALESTARDAEARIAELEAGLREIAVVDQDSGGQWERAAKTAIRLAIALLSSSPVAQDSTDSSSTGEQAAQCTSTKGVSLTAARCIQPQGHGGEHYGGGRFWGASGEQAASTEGEV